MRLVGTHEPHSGHLTRFVFICCPPFNLISPRQCLACKHALTKAHPKLRETGAAHHSYRSSPHNPRQRQPAFSPIKIRLAKMRPGPLLLQCFTSKMRIVGARPSVVIVARAPAGRSEKNLRFLDVYVTRPIRRPRPGLPRERNRAVSLPGCVGDSAFQFATTWLRPSGLSQVPDQSDRRTHPCSLGGSSLADCRVISDPRLSNCVPPLSRGLHAEALFQQRHVLRPHRDH
jgi:hypothetical protein